MYTVIRGFISAIKNPGFHYVTSRLRDWATVNVGAALAANNPSDRDEFAAEAASTKLKTSVFSVSSVANI